MFTRENAKCDGKHHRASSLSHSRTVETNHGRSDETNIMNEENDKLSHALKPFLNNIGLRRQIVIRVSIFHFFRLIKWKTVCPNWNID